MREATGNALLTMMIVSIITIILVFFVGSLSYSKSYKIKNYIVNEIEENGGWDANLQEKVDSYMKDIGYNVRKNDYNCNKVKNINTEMCTYINNQSNYDYCIYLCNNTDNNIKNIMNKYYKVVTFMKFEFPVIGDWIKFEVKGETNIFNDFNH